MKKIILNIICLSLYIDFASAQSDKGAYWVYQQSNRSNQIENSSLSEPNPNESDILHKTTTTNNLISTSTSTVPQWFPTPSGMSTTVQARIATTTIAKYTLIQQTESSNSLVIDATNGLNKFIIRNIDNEVASPVVRLSFRLKTHYKNAQGNPLVPDADAGEYHISVGHEDGGSAISGVEGSYFRDGSNMPSNNTITAKQAVFSGIRLKYKKNSSDMLFSHRKVLTKGADMLSGTAELNDDNRFIFHANGGVYDVVLYCNNSNSNQYYNINEVIHTVKKQTYHLFINSNKIGEYPIAVDGQSSLDEGKVLNAFCINTTGLNLLNLEKGSIEISDINADYTNTTSSSVLPVSLASFRGIYNNNIIKLNWKTLSEKDNSHFEVLRSSDGVTFNQVARVSGAGTSTEILNYSVTDNSPLAGINYYQLKQVDNNGHYSLSDVIAVNASFADKIFSVIKKNDGLSVVLNNKTASAVSVYVTDISGRKILSQKVPVSIGHNQFEVSTSLLNPGVYVFTVEGDGESKRIKFVN